MLVVSFTASMKYAANMLVALNNVLHLFVCCVSCASCVSYPQLHCNWVAILSGRCETVLKLLQTHSGTWRRSWQMPLKLTLKNIFGYTMTIEIKTGCSILCWNQHLEKKYGAKTREESEWWPFWEMRGRVAAFDGDINRRRVMGGNWCLSQSVSQE